ncbi:MAG: nuclease-related domain-containing protein [Acidimicrobiales bacterium]|jgi:hypothetical protein
MVEDRDPIGHIDLGRPGASARAEFERHLRQDAERRRRRFGRFLAPLVAVLAGVRPSTARCRVGGEAEERVGRLLSQGVGDGGLVLHGRRVPRSRANIDHIAVVPSGVWVIDTKRYRGRVRPGRPPGRFLGGRTLVVNGHDRGTLLAAARHQGALVEAVVGPGVAVHAVLCFADGEWGCVARPARIGGVMVTWPKALVRVLAGPGPLEPDQRVALATRIARAFPPCTAARHDDLPDGVRVRGPHRQA